MAGHFRDDDKLNADDLSLLITEHSAPYAAVQIANRHDQIVAALNTVTAIHLVADGEHAVVRVEINGAWHEAIRERLEAPFSHIIESGGLERLAAAPSQTIQQEG